MFLSKFCTLPGWFFLLFRRYVIILFGIGFLQKSDWRQKKFICKILNWIKMFTLQVLSERLVCSLNVYVVMIWYICKHLFDMLQILSLKLNLKWIFPLQTCILLPWFLHPYPAGRRDCWKLNQPPTRLHCSMVWQQLNSFADYCRSFFPDLWRA